MVVHRRPNIPGRGSNGYVTNNTISTGGSTGVWAAVTLTGHVEDAGPAGVAGEVRGHGQGHHRADVAAAESEGSEPGALSGRRPHAPHGVDTWVGDTLTEDEIVTQRIYINSII